MPEFQEKYLNPFTDYGFKRIFAEESQKILLIDFLNELLHEQVGKIKNLQYFENKHIGYNNLNLRGELDTKVL